MRRVLWSTCPAPARVRVPRDGVRHGPVARRGRLCAPLHRILPRFYRSRLPPAAGGSAAILPLLLSAASRRAGTADARAPPRHARRAPSLRPPPSPSARDAPPARPPYAIPADNLHNPPGHVSGRSTRRTAGAPRARWERLNPAPRRRLGSRQRRRPRSDQACDGYVTVGIVTVCRSCARARARVTVLGRAAFKSRQAGGARCAVAPRPRRHCAALLPGGPPAPAYRAASPSSTPRT